LLCQLKKWFRATININVALQVHKEALRREPLSRRHIRHFMNACAKTPIIKAIVAAWADLVNHHPYNSQFFHELVLACDKTNDKAFNVIIWQQLIENHRANIPVITAYANSLIKFGETLEGAVDERTFKDLVILYSGRPGNIRTEIVT